MSPEPPEIPDDLVATDLGPGYPAWRARLPRSVAEMLEAWDLRPDGPARGGLTAVVLPVRDADGRPAALKVGWPHPEAEHEHLALRAWDGQGAVRLLRAAPARSALLLERADAATDLRTRPPVEACVLVAGLYADLHRPAFPQLTLLSTLARRWLEQLTAVERHPQLPRRFVVQAVAHLRELVDLPTTDGTLLHTDLHDENVLASLRPGDAGAWLAIDPKPLSGDPAFEVAPLLWNRPTELGGAPSLREAMLERFYAVVDTAGLDEDRARAWVVVRGMTNVLAALERADRTHPLDQDWVTLSTTMVKAMGP